MQNVCSHADVCVNPFSVICNMAILTKMLLAPNVYLGYCKF